MFNYWTIDAYFIITFIWVSGTILNWFIREKTGYPDTNEKSENMEDLC